MEIVNALADKPEMTEETKEEELETVSTAEYFAEANEKPILVTFGDGTNLVMLTGDVIREYVHLRLLWHANNTHPSIFPDVLNGNYVFELILDE